LVGARLVPPALEAEYRGRSLRADGRTAAVVAGGLTLLSSAFFATDKSFVEPPALLILAALRGSHVLITLGFIWAALRTRRPSVLDAWSVAWAVTASLVIAAIQSTRPPDYFVPVVSDLVLIFAVWTLVPNRFALQLIGSAIATGASVSWIAGFRNPPSMPLLLLLGNTLLSANLAAGYVSWRFHRARRLQFLAVREQESLVEQLRESRERLQSVLDASTDGYWERDLVTGAVLHSARMNEITGRPAVDTLAGTDDWRSRMHPDDLRVLRPVYEAAMTSGGQHFDRVFRTRHADGSWRWVRSRGGVSARDLSGRPLRIAGTISDIQAQKEAEEALRASGDRHRNLVENLGAGVVVHEADTTIRLSNARAAEMLGLTQDQLRGKAAVDPAWRFVRDDGTVMPLDEYPVNRVLATKGPVVDQVAGVDRPATHDRVWVLINAYPIFREPGDIDHVVVTFVDITGWKQAEEALQRSEALRRNVMENFPNGVVGLVDRDLRYVLIEGTNTITATSPRSWQGRTLQEITPPEVLPVVEPAYRAALAGESRRVQIPLAGHLIDVLIKPVRDEAGAVTHGLFMTQDVTEKRALEEQLAVASRLAALGTLVAGVAHEINNPLTAQLAGQGIAIEEVQAVRDALGAGAELDRAAAGRRLGEALEALRDAQAGGERIARVVKDLTLFGRPDPRRTRVRLADVIEAAMRWLPGSIAHVATVQIEDRGAPDVMASPGQLGQVLVNLVTNASRSATGVGKVAIRVVAGPGSPGMATLEVTDDGAGIDPSVLGRIFDPFFTTRRVGEGMGLGLPICHSIVTAHGGTISATSIPGRGSSFRVELPAAADPA
jgi:PAS domain S-box-containing protein